MVLSGLQFLKQVAFCLSHVFVFIVVGESGQLNSLTF